MRLLNAFWGDLRWSRSFSNTLSALQPLPRQLREAVRRNEVDTLPASSVQLASNIPAKRRSGSFWMGCVARTASQERGWRGNLMRLYGKPASIVSDNGTEFSSGNRFVQQRQSVCSHQVGTCLAPSELQPAVTSRQSLQASVSCLPFLVLRFLNTTVDQFNWGGSP